MLNFYEVWGYKQLFNNNFPNCNILVREDLENFFRNFDPIVYKETRLHDETNNSIDKQKKIFQIEKFAQGIEFLKGLMERLYNLPEIIQSFHKSF